MPQSGKKQEAFRLFAQGKGPTDPEVKALGLKAAARKIYYWEWGNKGKPNPPASHPKPKGSPPKANTSLEDEMSDEPPPKEKPPKETAQKKAPVYTRDHREATAIVLRPKTIECGLSPNLLIGFNVGVDKGWWPHTEPFDNYLETINYHFWKDREIVLQGYIELEGRKDGQDNRDGAFSDDDSDLTIAT